MITKRIIPCLDVNSGRVVKGVNFVNLIDAGDPVEIAAAYDKAGADEVVFGYHSLVRQSRHHGGYGAQGGRESVYTVYSRRRNQDSG